VTPIGFMGIECRDLEHSVREFYRDGVRIGFVFYVWPTPMLRDWCDTIGVDQWDLLEAAERVMGRFPHSPYLPHEILESWDVPGFRMTADEAAAYRDREECFELLERQWNGYWERHQASHVSTRR
jgi:hypothetical protein